MYISILTVEIPDLSYDDIVKESIERINERSKSDKELKQILKEYDGKRLVVNVVDDVTCAVNISSDGLSVDTSTTANPEDMYLEIDKDAIKKIVNQEINILSAATLMLSGKIKIRNIGAKELDLVRGFFGS
jgi:hypothetical protein